MAGPATTSAGTAAAPAEAATTAASAEAATTAATEAAAAESWRRHLRSRTVLLRSLRPQLWLALGRPIYLLLRAILLRRLISLLDLTPKRNNLGRSAILLRCRAILLRSLIPLLRLALKSLSSRCRLVLTRRGLVLLCSLISRRILIALSLGRRASNSLIHIASGKAPRGTAC